MSSCRYVLWVAAVKDGNGLGKQDPAPADVSLPILTISYAHPAKPIGDFGLVTGGFTNRYHASDLSLPPFF